MASTPFMEKSSVGGIPIFIHMCRNYLPKSKKKRDLILRIQMIIFTYLIYSLFSISRRSFTVVQAKIIEKCNQSQPLEETNATWCDEIPSDWTSEEFLGIMNFVFIVSYGLCLYLSGIVGDCYNPRFYLTAGCLLSGYFCALLGLTDYWDIRSFKFLGTILILFGAAQSTAWPVVLSSVTHWYGVDGKRRGIFYGFWNTHNYIGSVLGIFLVDIWVDSKWMWSFFVPGFILIIAGILVFLCMLMDPKDLKELHKCSSESNKLRRCKSEIPSWLSTTTSITMYDALKLPGVIEFSMCMFFTRMVGYTFLYWLPVFLQRIKGEIASISGNYLLAYVVGGSLGGILAGIFLDLFKRNALVCASFLMLSLPALLVSLILDIGKDLKIDLPLLLIIGLFVEAPYIVIATTVSADLGTHKLVKRNYRALSTVGGIIEGTGAIGASIVTCITSVLLVNTDWTFILYLMFGCQVLAILCLSRQVYKDYYRKPKKEPIMDYLQLPIFSRNEN